MAFIDDIKSRDTALFPVVEIKTLDLNNIFNSGAIVHSTVMDETVTGLYVDDLTGFEIGQYIKIDDEIMRILLISDVLVFINVIRGLFSTSIESHSYATPIDRFGWNNISTKDFNLGNTHYNPLLLSTPSIKESIDLENRKYKISNVSLKISNVEYNGERFSDSEITLNTEVSIHWVSPSCTTIGECYLAYKGTVRAITHDEKTCNITLEDISQSEFHRDVPITLLGTADGFLDRYKNKPVPMVYGTVDRSPCVIGELSLYNIAEPSSNEINILTDNNSTVTLSAESPLAAFSGDDYITISQEITGLMESAFTHLGHPYQSGDQYSISGNIITLRPVYTASTSIDYDSGDIGFYGNPVAENFLVGYETIMPNAVVPIRAPSSGALQTWNYGWYATLPSVDTIAGEHGDVIGRWRGSVFRENTWITNQWGGDSRIPATDGGGVGADYDIWFDRTYPSGGGDTNYEAGQLSVVITTPITNSASYVAHYGHLRAQFNTYIYNYMMWDNNQDHVQPIRTMLRSRATNPATGLEWNDGYWVDTDLTPHDGMNAVTLDLPYYNSYDVPNSYNIVLYEPAEVQFTMYFHDHLNDGNAYGGGGAGVFEIYKWKTDHYMLMDGILKLDFYANDVIGRER